MSTISIKVESGKVLGFERPVYKDGQLQIEDGKKYLYTGDWSTARRHMAIVKAPEGCVKALETLDYWRYEPLVLDALFTNPTVEIAEDLWCCNSDDSILLIEGTYSGFGGELLTPPTYITRKWFIQNTHGGVNVLIQ